MTEEGVMVSFSGDGRDGLGLTLITAVLSVDPAPFVAVHLEIMTYLLPTSYLNFYIFFMLSTCRCDDGSL